jgi:Fe-S-cluster containining protein
MIIIRLKLFYFLVFLFFSYYSHGQDDKIVLIWESGGEFRSDKITITLQRTSSGNCYTYHHEECPIYSVKDKVCRFCRHFHGKAWKEIRIVRKETKIIKKTDFDNLARAIELLNIDELEKNNNLYYFGRIWRPSRIKLELYENDVISFSFKYASAAADSSFPTSLLPLNTIAKDIFKLAGIKSEKYCIK